MVLFWIDISMQSSWKYTTTFQCLDGPDIDKHRSWNLPMRSIFVKKSLQLSSWKIMQKNPILLRRLQLIQFRISCNVSWKTSLCSSMIFKFYCMQFDDKYFIVIESLSMSCMKSDTILRYLHPLDDQIRCCDDKVNIKIIFQINSRQHDDLIWEIIIFNSNTTSNIFKYFIVDHYDCL